MVPPHHHHSLRNRRHIGKPSQFFNGAFAVKDLSCQERCDEYSHGGNRGESTKSKNAHPIWHIDSIYENRYKKGELQYLIQVKEKKENGTPFDKEWINKKDWVENTSFVEAEEVYRNLPTNHGNQPEPPILYTPSALSVLASHFAFQLKCLFWKN